MEKSIFEPKLIFLKSFVISIFNLKRCLHVSILVWRPCPAWIVVVVAKFPIGVVFVMALVNSHIRWSASLEHVVAILRLANSSIPLYGLQPTWSTLLKRSINALGGAQLALSNTTKHNRIYARFADSLAPPTGVVMGTTVPISMSIPKLLHWRWLLVARMLISKFLQIACY